MDKRKVVITLPHIARYHVILLNNECDGAEKKRRKNFTFHFKLYSGMVYEIKVRN